VPGVIVRELNEADLPSAVGIVARGMRDNPLHIAALGDDAEVRGNRLIRMFSLALPLIFSKGVLLGGFQDDTLVGIAGIVPPGKCQPSMKEQVTVFPRIFPAVGGGAFVRVGRWMGTWASHDPAEPHWHLGPVAVDAHLQGRGIGSLLMSEYCARLDRARGVCYLETDTPMNVIFYEKFGFRTTGSAPVLNIPNWFMRRAAYAEDPKPQIPNPKPQA
jgi:ribosomal protein S18 acetylase RimI-like enzyme